MKKREILVHCRKHINFFKFAGLLLSVFNLNYLSRGKREVVLSGQPSHFKLVILCWKHSFQGSFFPLLFAFGFQRVWILWGRGFMLKLPLGSLGPVAPESSLYL